jgi:ABC-type branched-subunit amino acid transport system substrate-binding protein
VIPRKQHAFGRAACAVIAAALLSAACGTGGAGRSSSGLIRTGPGVDAAARTISLGAITPLSGAAATTGKPLTRGEEVYFKALNDAGGVRGWKINLVTRDDQNSPQLHLQAYNEIIDQVALIGQSLGGPNTLAIQPIAQQQKVLVLAASQSSGFVGVPNVAVIGTPLPIDVANFLDYVVRQLGKADARVGVVYQNDEYGQDALRGYDAGLRAYKFKDAGRAGFNSGDKELGAQVLKMKSAGAEYVLLAAAPTSAAAIVSTGATLGFNPTWVFLGPAWSEYLITADGSPTGKATPFAAAIAQKTWVLGFESTWGDLTKTGMKRFLDDQKRYAPDQFPDPYFMYGYAAAQMLSAVINKAIQRGDLTRSGILNAKLQAGRISLGGLAPDVEYTPGLGPASRVSNIAAVDLNSPGFLKIEKDFFAGELAKSMRFAS